MKYHFYALILVGGAAGLFCAISAKTKHPKLRVAVIEKNDRVGKKLLATGNGRCNLTNLHLSGANYTGSLQPRMETLLTDYNAAFLREEFGRLGLMTCADSEGRVYPVSKQASSVLDVLRFACERLGVELFCAETPHSVQRQQEGFTIKTGENVYTGDKLVIACGSKAAPKLGGSAAGMDILRNLGLRTAPFQPALCPVRVQSAYLKSLKGLRAAGSVSLWRGNQCLKTEAGEIQFADGALSGICVFNLSLFTQKGDVITADLLPDISERELSIILKRNFSLFSLQTADRLLTGILQTRLAQAVMKQSGVANLSLPCGKLTEQQLRAVAKTVKCFPFTVTENSGFDQAQCARGGVLASELDSKLQSKKIKNLFVCGEAVDICGICGGYNLHFAFVSGKIVGEEL
ncbi:MAG: aminoacetone oxidase family FAD-binding enzyme [Ruminococcus sp.]|nr:aminoacetone oxidase family FAD-binding enzyme [Ruminococcus sp.]